MKSYEIMSNKDKPAYAIDIVSNLIRELGGSEPIFFQRDGGFFAASNIGFGWASYGLRMLQEDKSNEDKPEWVGQIIEGDKERIAPFLYERPTLRSMVQAFRRAPIDDGQIRLIRTSYWAEERHVNATKMNKEKYFDLMRHKEEILLSGLETTARLASKEEQYSGENKKVVEMAFDATGVGRASRPYRIVDACVITPSLLFSFPRAGELNYHGRNEGWDDLTEFGNAGDVIKFGEIGRGWKSPFAATYRNNSLPILAKSSDELCKLAKKADGENAMSRDAILRIMPEIERYTIRLNEINNTAFKREIVLT